jgi:hypothetical protein
MKTDKSLAVTFLNKHASLNEYLNPRIDKLASINHGKLVDSEFALKTLPSTIRKMKTQDINDICDLTRYAIILEAESYTKNVSSIIHDIKASGIQMVKKFNYWNRYNEFSYEGFNSAWDIDGLKFELQFHTRESYNVKINIHPLYEIARLIPEGSKILNHKMSIQWKNVKVPENAINL